MSSSSFYVPPTLTVKGYPLSTIFTPPPSCSSSWTYNSVAGSTTIYQQLWQEHDPETPDSSCFPPGHVPWNSQSTFQIYSPGVCPYGYTTYFVYPGGVDTTAVCCPNHFSYSTTQSGTACISSLRSNEVTEVPRATGDTWATVTGPIPMWAEPIWIAYNQEEESRLPSPAASATSTASATSSATSSDSSSPSHSSNSGLSYGAKAGIGVGVGFGGLAIIIALAFFFIKRRRGKMNNNNNNNNGFPQVYEADSKQHKPPAELEVPLAEVEAKPPNRQNSPAELHG